LRNSVAGRMTEMNLQWAGRWNSRRFLPDPERPGSEEYLGGLEQTLIPAALMNAIAWWRGARWLLAYQRTTLCGEEMRKYGINRGITVRRLTRFYSFKLLCF